MNRWGGNPGGGKEGLSENAEEKKKWWKINEGVEMDMKKRRGKSIMKTKM